MDKKIQCCGEYALIKIVSIVLKGENFLWLKFYLYKYSCIRFGLCVTSSVLLEYCIKMYHLGAWIFLLNLPLQMVDNLPDSELQCMLFSKCSLLKPQKLDSLNTDVYSYISKLRLPQVE